MTYSKQEAEEAANKLVELTRQQKDISDQIKDLKANLIEFTDVEGLADTSWSMDNGFVEIKTETKYKLSEIPVETKVDANACPIDIAEQAFASKLYLTKEGKKMLREGYPSIVGLMIPQSKKVINVLS